MNTGPALTLLESKKTRYFHGYIIAAASFFILILTHGTWFTFGVFLKPLAEEFGWTRAMTSGAYSLAIFIMGPLAVLSGRLSDKFGPRIVITACVLFISVGYMLLSQVDSLWQLYLLQGVVIATGMSGVFVTITSTVARWFEKKRGLMTGIVTVGISLGTMILPPVASHLILSYGWRTTYTVVGAAALVLIIVLAQFLKRDPSKVGQLPYGTLQIENGNTPSQSEGFSLREATHTRQLWVFFASYVCFGFSAHTILVHLVAYATDLGMSPIAAAQLMTAIGGLGFIGRVGLGYVSDRASNKTALIIGLSTLVVALLWLHVAKPGWMLFLFALVFGFAYGGMAVLHPPVIAELFGMKAHGEILGLICLSTSIGGAVGPLVAGRIFDLTGSYYTGFLVSTIVSITGVILASVLKPTARKTGRNT